MGPMTNSKKSETNRTKFTAPARITLLLAIGTLVLAPRMDGQSSQSSHATDALHQLNESVETLVQRISPSVVQILVVGYSSTEDTEQGQMSVVIGKQRIIGSGVIVDPDGYIVTNAHVVKGAEKIEVVVPPAAVVATSQTSVQPNREQTYEARIVGVARQLDLAVIKIEAHKLSSIPIRKEVSPRQGEMVFAFGSPEGLRTA